MVRAALGGSGEEAFPAARVFRADVSGLRLQWRGRAAGGPSPSLVRVVQTLDKQTRYGSTLAPTYRIMGPVCPPSTARLEAWGRVTIASAWSSFIHDTSLDGHWRFWRVFLRRLWPLSKTAPSTLPFSVVAESAVTITIVTTSFEYSYISYPLPACIYLIRLPAIVVLRPVAHPPMSSLPFVSRALVRARDF